MSRPPQAQLQPPSERQTWKSLSVPGANVTYEARQAHALEYIAMYLDRIESHLDRLAKHGAEGAHVNGEVARILANIGSLLQERLKK